MNAEQYAAWEQDAARALSGRYTPQEVAIIIRWFSFIKGAGERDLVGDEAVEAMLVFVGARGRFDVYNSLMARLFIYAPFIIEEARQRQEL